MPRSSTTCPWSSCPGRLAEEQPDQPRRGRGMPQGPEEARCRARRGLRVRARSRAGQRRARTTRGLLHGGSDDLRVTPPGATASATSTGCSGNASRTVGRWSSPRSGCAGVTLWEYPRHEVDVPGALRRPPRRVPGPQAGALRSHWVDTVDIMAMPHDMLVSGIWNDHGQQRSPVGRQGESASSIWATSTRGTTRRPSGTRTTRRTSRAFCTPTTRRSWGASFGSSRSTSA